MHINTHTHTRLIVNKFTEEKLIDQETIVG